MRLIDADALTEDMLFRCNQEIAKYKTMRRALGDVGRVAFDSVKNAPTIDAEPVRHGRWIDEVEPNAVTASGREVHVFRCSACDFTWANKSAVLHYFNYCPNCGAKMRGDEDVSE